MILRRLAQHLNAQNWTAISVETLFRVVGVLRGLQGANRNAEIGGMGALNPTIGKSRAQRSAGGGHRHFQWRNALAAVDRDFP